MNERDARMLPKFLAIIETSNQQGEVFQAIAQVTRILKTDGKRMEDLAGPQKFPPRTSQFDQSMADSCLLADHVHDIRTKLRDLGLLLRMAQHTDPYHQMAMDRAREALEIGGRIQGRDLRVLLASVRDLLRAKIKATQQPRQEAPTPSQRFYPGDPLHPDYRPGAHTYTSANAQPDDTLTTAKLAEMMREALRKVHAEGGQPFDPSVIMGAYDSFNWDYGGQKKG